VQRYREEGCQTTRSDDGDHRLGGDAARDVCFSAQRRSIPYIGVMAKSGKTKAARVLSSRISYQGPVFSVTTDEVEEPGGVRARRDVIRHSGSIVVLAVEEPPKTRRKGEPQILLERQYRHAAQSMMWELPAGRIDDGETALTAAKRELLEETGYSARQWKRILHFYVSPGFLDETMTIYLARGLKTGVAQPEADERIAVKFFPLSEAKRMALQGRIRDAKTIAGILWLAETTHGSR
jgi:ADP-ribose pyrophosphatase